MVFFMILYIIRLPYKQSIVARIKLDDAIDFAVDEQAPNIEDWLD